MLEVKQVNKTYQSQQSNYKVLHNVDLKVEPGEFVAIMGPSGSGKTTLLNCLAGFLPVDSGNILLNNQDIAQLTKEQKEKLRQNDLGFVFQDFMLINGLDMHDNINLPQIISGKDVKTIENRTQQLLHTFDITSIAHKYVNEISGGQKQRVAIARALSNSPALILADEPTGNLDSKSSGKVIETFIKAKNVFETTILMVTHDSFSASYADRVIVLKDGRVVKELIRREKPSDLFHEDLLVMIKKISGDA